MILAFGFVEPLLLLGLLAAGIPFVLHLLSSVRAQEMFFPTLRFLRMSMEKTARRRRLQHWLLLLLRAGLFALLALAVAEPISRATGGWLSGQNSAAVIILDNGYSMAVSGAKGSRFERAKSEAASLLGGDDKPSMAAVMTTSGGFVSRALTSGLKELRDGINAAHIRYGPVPLAQRFQAALKMLQADHSAKKAIYLFSDMQRISFDQIIALKDLGEAKDVHVLVIDTTRGEASNVGISDLQVTGQRVVDSVLEFTATLVNSSTSDKTVDVTFQVDGAAQGSRLRKTLRPAGQDGSTAVVRFHQRFSQPGDVSGRVTIDTSDDLPLDNTRRFCLAIGGRVQALVVRGPVEVGAGMAPSTMLQMALSPYEDQSTPWPIRAKTVEADELAAGVLKGVDVLFLCEVPRFTAAAAKAVEDFTRTGGTTVIFLGPGVDAANYNDTLVQQVASEGGLLPGRLDKAVGEIGPEATSVKIGKVAVDHPFFAGLYENQADYLTVLVQRYYRLAPSSNPGVTLVQLADGQPLIVDKRFGGGRVVLCATTCGPSWSNLPISGLFLPMLARMSLLARHELYRDATFLAGAQAPIRPDLSKLDVGAGEKLFLHVTPPDSGAGHPPTVPLPLEKTAEGYLATFSDTSELGVYQWKVTRPGGGEAPGGAFVVNPFGPESQLEAMPAATFQRVMHAAGLPRVYVAPTLAEAHAAATAGSEGRNWWDLMLAFAVLVLVFEAIVANRQGADPTVPTHLQPR
jgi:hypothetical protein